MLSKNMQQVVCGCVGGMDPSSVWIRGQCVQVLLGRR